MKTLSMFLLCLLFLLPGCEKEKENMNTLYSARIVGFDPNCSTCIVTFPDDSLKLKKMLGESPNNFYEIVNLNRGSYEVGQMLKVVVRKAMEAEFNACITLYPSNNYQAIYALDFRNYSGLVLNDTIELKYKDCLHDAERQMYICLDSVISDSRCPTGLVCVWAGEATARFKIVKYNTAPVFIKIKEGAKDTLVNGYHFSFIKLLPYPDLKHQTKPEEYKALIMLK